ncbi:Spore coat protein CotF [Seinonella peptonophila]|uniref:Spore coat protein CotF n=1 Tax=Seinonella peptonophila TaxID=112248 RepID=A0A1M4W7M5_9BACL|nr:spore coat protein [Seinonella peptonophila]SHE76972.1 Spore coat protein CotF [Seinonella peptonophila]
MQIESTGQQTGMQSGSINMNHGGHELNDVQEVLKSTIGLLEQYVLFRDHIQDQELSQILDRQYQFILDEYNMLVQSFSTGQDPTHGTKKYEMIENNDTITYGLTPGQPKTPKMSTNEINCACISGFMLGLLKTMASAKTMASLEVTNPVVRRVLQDSIPNCIEMAYELSLWQNRKGHYQIAQYSPSDMQTILHGFATAQGSPQSSTTYGSPTSH